MVKIRKGMADGFRAGPGREFSKDIRESGTASVCQALTDWAVIPLHISLPSFKETINGRSPLKMPRCTSLAITIATLGTPPNGSVGGMNLGGRLS